MSEGSNLRWEEEVCAKVNQTYTGKQVQMCRRFLQHYKSRITRIKKALWSASPWQEQVEFNTLHFHSEPINQYRKLWYFCNRKVKKQDHLRWMIAP